MLREKLRKFKTQKRHLTLLTALLLLTPIMTSFWQPVKAQTEEKLVVLMPTPSAYTEQYIERFEEWYFNQTGKTIKVEHVRKGGVDCPEHVIQQEGKPYEDVIASIGYKESEVLRQSGYLDPYISPNSAFIPETVLENLVGKDPRGYYTGFSLSGYGIMVNTEVQQKEGLTMPKGYFDLSRDTSYHGRIVMGSPIMSRIAHGNIEVMLSHFEWVPGWNTILYMSSLVDMYTETTGIANNLTAEGEYAATLTKYSYWYEFSTKGYPVEWIWPEEGTYIYILYTGVLKGARHSDNAQLWVDWMLSEEGQRAWAEIRYETVLRSDITLPTGMLSIEELSADARIEQNYSEDILAERYDTVTELCINMIGYHPELKRNYDNPDVLDAYLEKWVIEPKQNAEEELSSTREAIEQSKTMSLTNQGLYLLVRADLLLAEAESENKVFNHPESHKLAMEAGKLAAQSMAYLAPPPPPLLWPYYLIIGVISLTLVGVILRRVQIRRYARRLEQKVEERTRGERRRAEQLRAINEVGRKISSILSLDELLPYVVSSLRETFNYYNVNIFLLDPGSDGLVLKACAGGYKGSIPVRPEAEMAESIVGWVAENGEPLMVGDVSKEPKYLFVQEFADTQSELTVPIKIGTETLGVLDIQSTEPNAFDEIDLFTAQTLTDQVAIGIENARLYQETREMAVIEERNRMAREIHDTLAQGFTGIVLQLEAAEQLLDENIDTAHEHLDHARRLARESLNEARRSVWALRPQTLEQLPLIEALSQETENFTRDSGIKASFDTSGNSRTLPVDMENALLRICQESLANVKKHAKASQIKVNLSFAEEVVKLSIHDNGAGFDSAVQVEGAFGLIGMKERARLMGGTMVVRSEVGKGTLIEVTVPINGG